MREEQRLHCDGSDVPLVEQLPEQRHHAGGADPGAYCVLEAFRICLCLVLATEAGEDRASRNVYRGASRLTVADAGQNAREGHSDVGALCFFHLLDGVATYDVSDLVAKNSRQLVHLIRALDQS